MGHRLHPRAIYGHAVPAGGIPDRNRRRHRARGRHFDRRGLGKPCNDRTLFRTRLAPPFAVMDFKFGDFGVNPDIATADVGVRSLRHQGLWDMRFPEAIQAQANVPPPPDRSIPVALVGASPSTLTKPRNVSCVGFPTSRTFALRNFAKRLRQST